MKKLLTALLLTALLISAASCSSIGKNSNGDTETGTNTSETSGAIETEEEKCNYTFEIAESISTVHETEDGRKSMKVLRYPVLSGISDEELEEKVNEAFREIAENKYREFVPDEEIYIIEDNMFTYEVEASEVTLLTNRFISVKNTVYSMAAMSAYPSCPAYTVNIDLTTGEIIDGEDIFADFNIITSKFILGEFEQVYGEDALMENTTYEDMILQYKSDYENYPQVYFTDDSLVICIDLIDSLGSSAGFSAPLADLTDALKLIP